MFASGRAPSQRIAVVGAAESDLGRVPDKTASQLQAQAAVRALEDAGLKPADVDGVCAGRTGAVRASDSPALEVAEYLGIQPRWIDSTAMGGASFLGYLLHAAAAIQGGLASVVLITYGSTQYSDRARRLGGWETAAWLPEVEFERPAGPLLPISSGALLARRRMHDYGTTSEQLAAAVVASRAWAALNPSATRREALTVEDVLQSPMISSPLRALDCCLVSDGGGAVVVSSLERARSCRRAPVELLGGAARHTHRLISQIPQFGTTAAKDTGERALAAAGLAPSDMDFAQLYDAFSILPIVLLEDLGFCGRGEGGPLVASGATRPGGAIPTTTQGGGLSYCHPGMFGIFLIIEAVRQLRAECGQRQIPDAEVGLCHGMGGAGSSSHVTLVFGKAA